MSVQRTRINPTHGANASPLHFRLSGFIPLCFFLLNWIYHARTGFPHHILWLCNLNNLLLAVGIIFDAPVFARIAILWLIPALPLWLIQSWEFQDFPIASILSHAGALVFGILTLQKIRMSKNVWIFATLYALAVQQVSRWITPCDLNINVAFKVYQGWQNIFPAYFQFWLYIAFLTLGAMFLLNLLLSRLFPYSPQWSPTARAQPKRKSGKIGLSKH